jgi:hypothetical protein
MNTFCSATFVSLLLLFPSLAAQAQSNFVDVSSNAAEPAIITPPSTHPYGEFTIYTNGTLANPQIMSDLKGQRLFFAGVRTTSRLFTTPHLFIGGNLDVKPLVIHSRTLPSGRQYTSTRMVAAFLLGCNLRLASPGIGNRFSTLTEVLSVSLTMSRFQILAG